MVIAYLYDDIIGMPKVPNTVRRHSHTVCD